MDGVTGIEFVMWLGEALADDETLLIGRQRYLRNDDGTIATYPNGTLKSYYLASIPNPRSRRLEGALYVNTGVFSRALVQESPSASYTNSTGVAFMMLDDIGTKVPFGALAVPPTWIIETSMGNFQAGYAFSEIPTSDDFCATISAMARAGFTDAGATNGVRWARIPGSENIKPGRDGFLSRLIEWHKDREYTLDDIIAGYNLTILDDDRRRAGPGNAAIKVKDDGNDNVLHWLSDNAFVFSQPNSDGWYSVQCPNAEAHTDGSPAGRYNPVNRAYSCFHSHCTHLTSNDFLAWVAEQGGPREIPGVREELITGVMAPALKKLEDIRAELTAARPDATLFPPGGNYDAAQQAALAQEEEERREAARVERDDWFSRYCYVESDDGYFDTVLRKLLTRQNFDAIYRHALCRSRHGRQPHISPSRWFDENRNDMNGYAVRNVIYAPGHGTIMISEGEKYGNLWVDTRPAGDDGDASPWLDHIKQLVPTDWEREHFLDWMAYKVQNPGVKINHQVYWGSQPGAGKDTALEAFIYSISGAAKVVGRSNTSVTTLETLLGQWGYDFNNELIIINEAKEPSNYEQRQAENRLKFLCAAPPVTLTVNLKHKAPYSIVNQASLVAMSNYRDGLRLPGDDRRWFVLWTDNNRMLEEDARRLWQWYKDGGLSIVAGYLAARDVSEFNAKGYAPWTEAKAVMCDDSLSDSEAIIAEEARARRGIFTDGILVSPFERVMHHLQSSLPSAVASKVSQRAIVSGLKAAGWKDMGRVTARGPNGDMMPPRRIFSAPGVEESGVTRSDMRRFIDTPPEPTLKVVKNN